MANFYKLGVHSGTVVIHPAITQFQNRMQLVTEGFGNIRRGEERFYKRGINPGMALQVGAQTPGPLGTLADGVVGLLLDVAHVLLVFAGMYALWQGLHGGF